MALKQINPEQLGFNPFEAIGRQWFLLTAGNRLTGWNTMTCSWGAAGVLWNKPSVTCYVRHSRYTLDFMELQDVFTLSFLGDEHRKALAFCGSHSGRNCDKAAESGLHPVELGDAITFEEAKLVFICKKRYAADMDIADIPEDAKASFYGDNDAHRLYIGEIVACYQQD